MPELDEIKQALEQNKEQATLSYQGSLPQKENLAQKYLLTPLGKTLDVLDTDLNATTNLLRPIFEGLNPKLKEVYDNAPKKFGMPNVVPSDLIEKSLENTPGHKWLSKILGWTADVALSPTTYIAGLGTLTKEGQLLTKIKSLLESGILEESGSKGIALDSDLAKEIASHYGQQATPGLIGRAIRDAKAFDPVSLAKQAQMGQRALINIGIPFTKNEIPLIRSQLFFRSIDEGKQLFKDSKFGELFTKMFSTSTGNPIFDANVRQKALAILGYRESNVKAAGAEHGKDIEEFMKLTGKSREETFAWLTDIAESPYRGDISAKSVQEVFGPNIDKQVVDAAPIEKLIDSIPGSQSMVQDERAKLFNALSRNAKEKSAGFDVFTNGFLHLPEDVRKIFVNTWAKTAGIKIARDIRKPVGELSLIEYADLGHVVQSYNQGIKSLKMEPGLDAGLLALVGKKEYKRLIENEQTFVYHGAPEAAAKGIEKTGVIKSGYVTTDEKLAQVHANKLGDKGKVFKVAKERFPETAFTPESNTLSVNNFSVHAPTEADAMRDVVSRVVAHVDQGFSLANTMYKVNPEYLKKTNFKMYKMMKAIDDNPAWKIQTLQDQFHFSLEDATKFPKAFDLAQKYRSYMQNQLQVEKNAGVPISEWIGDSGYATHVPTKGARKLLSRLFPEYSNATREWNRDHLNTLQRQLSNLDVRSVNAAINTGKISRRTGKALLESAAKGNGIETLEQMVSRGTISENFGEQLKHYLTVSETNLLAKSGKLKILGGQKLEEGFFEVNPTYQILVRGTRGARAWTAAEMYKASEQFATLHDITKSLPEGYEFVKNQKANPLAEVVKKTVLVKGKPEVMLQRRIFEKGIADHLNALHEALVLPAAGHPLLNIFDGMQNEWKAWTLAIFPAYHTRNIIGNVWNNYLAGIHTAEPYLKALKVQRKQGVEILGGNGVKYTSEAIRDLSEKLGIVNIGQYWGDIEQYFRTDVEEGIKKYWNKAKAPVNFGLKTGNHFQNNANIALFIHRLEAGFSPEAAAMEVKKYQFDYKDLTAFEREVMKRIFPFYSWTRKNVPLQLEALLTHPSRVMAVAKTKNVMESNYDGVPDERLLPDYMTQNFPIRVRYDKGRKQFEYFLLNNWLPAADIDKIFDPITWVKNSLTPLLKEPAQQLANRDFFTNKEIDSGDEYQTISILTKKLSFNVPARWGHLIKNVRAVSELDRLSDPDLSTAGKIIRVGTGKLYPLNEDKQRQFVVTQFKDKEDKLKFMLKKAASSDNPGEVKRIIKKLEELETKTRDKLQ